MTNIPHTAAPVADQLAFDDWWTNVRQAEDAHHAAEEAWIYRGSIAPAADRAVSELPLYLWEHDSLTSRVATVEDAKTFTAGNPRWYRAYPVELVAAPSADRAELAAECRRLVKTIPAGALRPTLDRLAEPIIAAIERLASSREPTDIEGYELNHDGTQDHAHFAHGHGPIVEIEDGDKPIECGLELPRGKIEGEHIGGDPWPQGAVVLIDQPSSEPARSTDAPAEPRKLPDVSELLTWAVEDELLKMPKIMDADLQDALVAYSKRILALATPSSEPIAYVPVHPKRGPLWMDAYDAKTPAEDIAERRTGSYPVMAVYATPPAAATPLDPIGPESLAPEALRNALMNNTLNTDQRSKLYEMLAAATSTPCASGEGDAAHFRRFFDKHALGPLSAPSCLCCGQSVDGHARTPAITHGDLPGIVVCSECHARLAATQAPAVPATNQRQQRLDASMAKFDTLGPLPGMIAAFEAHFGQKWTDVDWRNEASVWAAAWAKAARAPTAGNTEDARSMGAVDELPKAGA